MKSIFALVVIVLMMGKAYSQEIKQFCMTEPRSTTFAVVTNGDVVKVGYMHHRGVSYMPIHNGLITPNDLGLLAERAELFQQLGTYIEFSFPLSKCQRLGDYNFSCMDFRGEEREINGHKVKGFAAYSAIQSETSFAGDYAYAVVNISLDIDGKAYHLPMRYDLGECAVDFQKKDFPFIK